MQNKDYCGNCEEAFLESELYYPNAQQLAWHKALGITPEPLCNPCTESAWESEQDNLHSV